MKTIYKKNKINNFTVLNSYEIIIEYLNLKNNSIIFTIDTKETKTEFGDYFIEFKVKNRNKLDMYLNNKLNLKELFNHSVVRKLYLKYYSSNKKEYMSYDMKFVCLYKGYNDFLIKEKRYFNQWNKATLGFNINSYKNKHKYKNPNYIKSLKKFR